jgi:hypothetical protein
MHEKQMDDMSDDQLMSAGQPTENVPDSEQFAEEIKKIRDDFHSRLIVAKLQTEAVRAGMVDLDGLKLISLADAQLGPDDSVVGGRAIIDELRRTKPWLFATPSSSSVAEAPASKAPRQKTALEMTDEEYLAARAALTRRTF